VLYFTESWFDLRSDMALVSKQRSVLQIAPVVQLANGSLRADRSMAVATPVNMLRLPFSGLPLCLCV
jgi:hypothetical protein